MNLYEAVQSVKETQGTNAKLEALKNAVAQCSLFKEFLECVYSDAKTYNVRGVEIKGEGVMELDDCFDAYLSLLHRLNVRELTGNRAREQVDCFAAGLTKQGQELLEKTLQRSVDFGLNVTGINKVVPSLLPCKAYMRCSGYNGNAIQKWFNKEGEQVLAQEKMDGMFVVINLNDRSIRTRSGKYFDPDLFQDVWSDLENCGIYGGCCLHGEILTFDDKGQQNPREISNGILNSTLKVGTNPENYKIFIWDCVDVETEQGYADTHPYQKRFWNRVARIKDCKVLEVVNTRMVTSFEDIHDFYQSILRKGGEGLVIKRGGGVWENKTSKDQLKMKQEVDLDLVIVGYNAGRGKFQGQVGSVICETSDGKLRVDVSGMNDAMRRFITDNADSLLGYILCVKANSIMENPQGKSSLFLPRFVELREDKTEADSFERVKELFSKF